MNISQQEVSHIAQLARIELSEDEQKMCTTQLGAIFDFINQLNEVDTQAIEPTSQLTGLINSYRDDEVAECSEDERRQLLRCVPELTVDEGVQVKQLFE